MNDQCFMRRCLQLAKTAEGQVAPNPMVGAVLVYDGRIIGEGYHKYFGGPHAEVNCIASVPAEARHLIEESTLYVSLEPCSHFGKTPPCTNLIIDQKIKKVIIGCTDIFHKVDGKGIQKLRDAGVKVEAGICESECMEMNKRFFTFHHKRRPYIILKWAQTSNGVIGSKHERLYISNAYTNILVQKWRSEEAGILIGHQTALQDNPAITNRYGRGKDPVRIIFDETNALPDSLKVFQENGRVIVFNCSQQKVVKNVSYIKINPENFISGALDHLYKSDIQSIIVEGGSKTHQRFLDVGIWDECRIITNTLQTASGISAAITPEMKLIRQEKILADMVSYYENPQNHL